MDYACLLLLQVTHLQQQATLCDALLQRGAHDLVLQQRQDGLRVHAGVHLEA